MTQIAFSIVIPNFNYAAFLPRAVESALAQEHESFEVIVVDDASTDDSRAVIARYADRVTPVLKPRNEGHGGAFNSGFAASRGETVLFVDADDWLYPGALRRIAASRRREAAMYQYRLDLVDGAGRAFDLYPPAETAFQDGDVRPELARRGRFTTTVTTGLAFSRTALNEVLPMDVDRFRQGGDGYLATVAPLYGEVVTVPAVLGAYRQHGANHSQFAQALAKKARWRLEHDEARLEALRARADRLETPIAPDAPLNDPVHLEARIASLRFEPTAHPYPQDRPSKLARRALHALRRSPLPSRRRLALQTLWLVAGYAPRPLAAAVVSWQFAAATRPAWVDRLAKLVRAATGRGKRAAAT